MESDAFVPSVLLDIAVWDVCVYHCSAGKHDHELLTVASTENQQFAFMKCTFLEPTELFPFVSVPSVGQGSCCDFVVCANRNDTITSWLMGRLIMWRELSRSHITEKQTGCISARFFSRIPNVTEYLSVYSHHSRCV